jgi:hypothetical protein
MLRFLLLCLVISSTAVSPMMSLVRKIQYASAAAPLSCGICKEALYVTWGQSPASIHEFITRIPAACNLATRRDPKKKSQCISVLSTHSKQLFRGNLNRGKLDCLLTSATDCEEVSKWAVHCDQKKKPCRVTPV